jgi:hypothetical protein
MTEYLVLIPGDETAWKSATQEHRQEVYGLHEQFSKLLAERGHKVLGGAELADSSEARTVRPGSDGTATVTEGPYAETVEQLTGYYHIESDDLDDLVDVCKVLAGEEAIEVRRILRGGS